MSQPSESHAPRMKSLAILLLCLLLAACTKAAGPGGVVEGIVFGDQNGDGGWDPGDAPLPGVDVDLSGCGPALTQATGADGSFVFSCLPAGSCLLQVSKAGWGNTGSFPAVGYPIPVASDPTKPTALGVYIGSMQDNIPSETCTNELDVVSNSPIMKADMAPGQAFIMSWTVLNEGTCTWSADYHLVFRGGPSPSQGSSSMGAALSTSLGSLVPVPVPPGQQVTIALPQTAPTQPGWYVGAWGIDGPAGEQMTISHGTTVDSLSSFYADIVVKPGIAPPGPASIQGQVWHDLCALPDGPLPPAPPPGCIPSGGSYEANGVLDAGEPGIPNVTLRLGSGACPSSGLAAVVSGAGGVYSFPALPPGDYCVSVGALTDGNDTVLIPGGWTFPVAHANPQYVDLNLGAGQIAAGTDFGWDYQFLPAWTAPAPTPTAPAAAGFSAPIISTPIFYYRGMGCGPREVDLGVQIFEPGARNVVLFFRLKDPASSQTTDWNEGVAMMAQGNGLYSLTLASESIAGFATFPQAFLQFQFIAEGAGGEILGRSPVYPDVTLEVCNR